ncbi:MAG: DNA repair exonuclease [Candidatus Woesearchaeota archaeon]
MAFVHLADIHLGAWREPKLEKLQIEAFKQLTKFVLERKPEFLLISGDLFDTPLPKIEIIKLVFDEFKKINQICPIFYISGSHDYSPSGKTILSILESAELCKNIEIIEGNKLMGLEFKDYYLTGISGRSRSSETELFQNLTVERKLNKKNIFAFHISISEIFNFPGIYLKDLPMNFDYYAGGHIHIKKTFDFEGKKIIYPGPFFPHVFEELWDELGSFVYVDLDKNQFEEINTLKNKIEKIEIDGEFTSNELNSKLLYEIFQKNLANKILLIKIQGILKKGSKFSEINFKEIIEKAYSNGCYLVLRNTNKLEREEFEEVILEKKNENEMIEEIVFKNKNNPLNLENEKIISIVNELLTILSSKKEEGMKNEVFENMLLDSFEDFLKKNFNI